MDLYTKAHKKRLRRLSDTAYENELDHELEKLYRADKIPPPQCIGLVGIAHLT